MTAERIKKIVSILDNWGGRLTWSLLIASIERQTRQLYSRQALFAHTEISIAFASKKRLLAWSGKQEPYLSPELKAAQSKIASLESTVERQGTLIATYEQQFVLWTYNASTQNLSLDFLNRPMSLVDRGQTIAPKQRNKVKR